MYVVEGQSFDTYIKAFEHAMSLYEKRDDEQLVAIEKDGKKLYIGDFVKVPTEEN